MADFRNRVDKILKTATKVFGEDVTLLPKKGGRYSIKGIFDNEFEIIDTDTEQTVISNQPRIGINLHNLEIHPKVGDQIKIRNLNFKIVEVREDGQGGASLHLHKVSHGQKVFKKKSD